MKMKTLTVNAIIAALYVTVSLALPMLSYGNIQFRIAEMFNHLIVFNKRYFFGIVAGVFITNLFSPLGIYDLTFGVAHSIISLTIVLLIIPRLKTDTQKMIANTIVFTFTTFIIAYELLLVLNLPFYLTWLTVAAGELVVLLVGIPIFKKLNERLDFAKLVE
ncbi:QueT transporter family protein [Chryseomicrobium sp. FSL W7-1435]|uniref:QueT transporter family protein n=1 Tax=Chryseomicrobium sp. FSL W7-1435 TaxID=2921704 RepID=UPI00315B0F9E